MFKVIKDKIWKPRILKPMKLFFPLGEEMEVFPNTWVPSCCYKKYLKQGNLLTIETDFPQLWRLTSKSMVKAP